MVTMNSPTRYRFSLDDAEIARSQAIAAPADENEPEGTR